MPNSIEFPWLDEAQLPQIEVGLSRQGRSVLAPALLDSGSTVNVLPYDLGVELGAIWSQQTMRLPLAGNLAEVEARAIFVNVQVGNLAVVKLAFAWTASSQVPLILGQTNFFREFDVCFNRSQRAIKITRLQIL